MKILVLSHKFDPDIGGIEINSEVLANEFDRKGHFVKVVTWSKGVSSKKFPYEITRNPKVMDLLRLYRWADVVFENNPSLKLSWPLLVLRVPKVVALNTWISRPNGTVAFRDRLKKWWLGKSEAVISVSRAIALRTYPDAIVIGNPFNSAQFKTLEGSKKSLDFLFLGRLVSDKGVDLAINAISDLAKEDIIATLTIVGDGPEMSDLVRLIESKGLRDRVKLTGALRGEVLVETLNKHRFIVVPSRWEEPFGNVALEGMACGCVPVVSDGGGLPDAVGSAGLVFQRGSVDALVSAMKSLMTNKSLELELRSAGPAHLVAHRPEVVAERYLEVLESVTSK